MVLDFENFILAIIGMIWNHDCSSVGCITGLSLGYSLCLYFAPMLHLVSGFVCYPHTLVNNRLNSGW